MHILVLGGSVFVGPALIESALARGWHVAAFNNDADWRAMPGVQHLRGDRTHRADVARLQGRRWDLVFDTWAGPSDAVRQTAKLLSGSVGAYVYISSLTVYQPQASRPLDETCAVLDRLPRGSTESYAARKLAAERYVAEVFPAENLIVRAGLLLGPRERPGRLPWWLDRLDRFGEVIAPAPRERVIQYADVRDLADWALRCAVDRRYGTYNFACPPGHATMGELMDACRAAAGGMGRLHWIEQEELLRHGVRPWTGATPMDSKAHGRPRRRRLQRRRRPGLAGRSTVPGAGGNRARHSRVAGSSGLGRRARP